MTDNSGNADRNESEAQLFIAIPIPNEIRAQLAELQARLQTGCRFVDAHPRWVSTDNLHLTVVFLGNTPRSKIAQIKVAMDEATCRFQVFDVLVSKLGFFPPGSKNPKVLSLGVSSKGNALQRMHGAMIDRLYSIGFIQEQRPYSPHLTLARLPGLKSSSRLAPLVTSHAGMVQAKFPVTGVVLYESRLGQEGPTYTELHTAILSA